MRCDIKWINHDLTTNLAKHGVRMRASVVHASASAPRGSLAFDFMVIHSRACAAFPFGRLSLWATSGE